MFLVKFLFEPRHEIEQRYSHSPGHPNLNIIPFVKHKTICLILLLIKRVKSEWATRILNKPRKDTGSCT